VPGMDRSAGGAEHRAEGAGSAVLPRTSSSWSSSGLGELTGRDDGPGLGPPPELVPGVHSLAEAIARDSTRLGRTVDVDPLGLMADRARLGDLSRHGPVSCGGSTRLLPSAEGWLAVSLARPSDWELVAAWLGTVAPVAPGDWARVAAAVERKGIDELMARSSGLGLPIARVGERQARIAHSGGTGDGIGGVPGRQLASGRPPESITDVVVADLSTLWAGPLVGSLLVRAGAQVMKVESSSRPDGARHGSPAHFASLNAGKEHVAVDLVTPGGRRTLQRIVDASDVVITSARPRAVEQLGLDPEGSVRHGRTRIWLSITGYGAGPGSADRVAFGDDAAAAGGLVVRDDRGLCFCADAVADPVTGLAATAAVLDALVRGGDHLLEASMADVAGSLAGEAGPGEHTGTG